MSSYPRWSWSTYFFPRSCARSLIESDDFICESDYLWNERKYIYQSQDKENMMKRNDSIFFLSNWAPNFHCSHARRIGNMGDGGKWICDLFRLKDHPHCLIYSVGSNGDFSFEIHLKKAMPRCEIHTFDTFFFNCPKHVCTFHQIAFGNGIHPKESKTWAMIIKELNHTNRLIDVLKIDIEGNEYGFFPLIFNSTKPVLPRQILVEVHPQQDKVIHGFFELLRTHNYVIFNKEPNLLAGRQFFEYAFLKLNSHFFD